MADSYCDMTSGGGAISDMGGSSHEYHGGGGRGGGDDGDDSDNSGDRSDDLYDDDDGDDTEDEESGHEEQAGNGEEARINMNINDHGDSDPDDDDDDDDSDNSGDSSDEHYDDGDSDDDDDGDSDDDDDSDSDESGDEEQAGNGEEARMNMNIHDNGDSDPDDPIDQESASENDEPNFRYEHRKLDTPCRNHRNFTVREVMALYVAIAVQENWTYVSLLRVTKAFNVLYGKKYLPENKKTLWDYLGKNSFGVKKISYCPKCREHLGVYERLQDQIRCPNGRCGNVISKKKVKYFFILSIKKQLQHFLNLPRSREILNYRNTREKKVPNGMEDIVDGQKYQVLRQPGN